MKIIILGAGLVGGPMAVDLVANRDFEVTAVDRDAHALEQLSAVHRSLKTICCDLSDPTAVRQLVHGFDLAICAVPGFMGFATLKAIIEAGTNVVDISFFPESCFELNELAQSKGVVAIVDCGVAPGMSNILTGLAHAELDETTSAITYVGGLPALRQWPYEYKAVFSPIDVIEEYTRPARYVENGALVVRPALSDAELLSFPGVGTLEAFNSDGLRTLIQTIDAPNLKEKTLRYPGHIEKMAVLRETGFFDTHEIEINGARIRPIDFTAKLLFPKWKLEPGETDLTVMQVMVEGRKNGHKQRIQWDLLDRYDPLSQVHSMARTTGYTATAVATLLTHGLYKEVGISPPEYLGRHRECVDFILQYLEERGVVYVRTEETTD